MMSHAEQRARREAMQAQYERGDKLAVIAAAFGISVQRVSELSHRWEWKRPGQNFTAEQHLRARWAHRMPAMKAAIRTAALND